MPDERVPMPEDITAHGEIETIICNGLFLYAAGEIPL